MKSILKKALVVIAFSASVAVMSSSAEAYTRYYYNGYHGYHGYGYGYRNNYYGNRYYGYKCRWVGGYWRHGYWYPAKRACWR